jgi:hypothetical protein
LSPNTHVYIVSFRLDEWELNRDRLRIDFERKLGSGAFSTVYLGDILTLYTYKYNLLIFTGSLRGEPPVKVIQPSIVGSHLKPDCQVAVKMLPHHADAIQKADFMKEIMFMKVFQLHSCTQYFYISYLSRISAIIDISSA